MRVHEFAKELKVAHKDLLVKLQAVGLDVRNHMSALDDVIVQRIRMEIRKGLFKVEVAPPEKKIVVAPVVEKKPEPAPEPAPEPEKIEKAAKPEKAEKKPAAKAESKAGAEAPAPKTTARGKKVAAADAVVEEKKPEAVKPAAEQPAAQETAAAMPPKPAVDKKTASAPAAEKKLEPASAPVSQPQPEKKEKPQAPKIEPKADAPKPVPARSTKAPPPETRPQPVTPPAPTEPVSKVIKTRGAIIVRDFADKLGIRSNRLIAELMGMNVLAKITESISLDVARKIAEKHGFTFEHEKKSADHEQFLKKKPDADDEADRAEDLLPRPPVVTFMGHVDHGKTSLLDRIRKTQVAKGEHGGITQHIGAYTVDINGRKITFLDTPGHAAFTAMRARGATLTDIVVIVIAADDGIMPQTKEALMHAKAASVTIMVAINKMDLPAANVDRVKTQLQAEGLAPEDWGGTVVCVPVSAQTGKGIEHLLEMILLQAEVLDLRANPKRRAKGYVIEAQMKAGMGPTVSLLVKAGTLNIGDAVLCGAHYGRIRALINDHGIKVKSAGPGTPIKCLGLSGVPEAGAEFRVCANDKLAREQAGEYAERMKKENAGVPVRTVSLENLFDKIKDQKRLEFKIILKADTQGSVEAIKHGLQEIKSDKVTLDVIFGSTGNVTENDVMLAKASGGIILGFNAGKEPGVDAIARHEGVEINLHHIIYELIDQVRAAMTGMLAPIYKENVVGHAEILQVFPHGKAGKVAGCRVLDGSARTKIKVRVKRGKEVLFEGTMDSLKHFRESVSEVKEGNECGIRLAKFSDFQPGDIFEFYELEQLKQDL
ncbi:MAG: translation initiation factor IF-2 [Verrucomicrobia bacterium]|nr:translation initiation factor IF-2 [Verrucomicrobiota bacterium]